jgi:hypothetical protein
MLEGEANVDGEVRVEEGREEILRAEAGIEERRGLKGIELPRVLGRAAIHLLLLGRRRAVGEGGGVGGAVHVVGRGRDVAVHGLRVEFMEKEIVGLERAIGQLPLAMVYGWRERRKTRNPSGLSEVIPSVAQTIEISRVHEPVRTVFHWRSI